MLEKDKTLPYRWKSGFSKVLAVAGLESVRPDAALRTPRLHQSATPTLQHCFHLATVGWFKAVPPYFEAFTATYYFSRSGGYQPVSRSASVEPLVVVVG